MSSLANVACSLTERVVSCAGRVASVGDAAHRSVLTTTSARAVGANARKRILGQCVTRSRGSKSANAPAAASWKRSLGPGLVRSEVGRAPESSPAARSNKTASQIANAATVSRPVFMRRLTISVYLPRHQASKGRRGNSRQINHVGLHRRGDGGACCVGDRGFESIPRFSQQIMDPALRLGAPRAMAPTAVPMAATSLFRWRGPGRAVASQRAAQHRMCTRYRLRTACRKRIGRHGAAAWTHRLREHQFDRGQSTRIALQKNYVISSNRRPYDAGKRPFFCNFGCSMPMRQPAHQRHQPHAHAQPEDLRHGFAR